MENTEQYLRAAVDVSVPSTEMLQDYYKSYS